MKTKHVSRFLAIVLAGVFCLLMVFTIVPGAKASNTNTPSVEEGLEEWDTEILPGDFDGKTGVTDSDALYLLRHTLFPNKYPLSTSGDVNADGRVSDSDAMYLLRHTLFPAKYPLFPKV